MLSVIDNNHVLIWFNLIVHMYTFHYFDFLKIHAMI